MVTADVACINPGNNEPRAENKHATIAEGDFPVQNGKALLSIALGGLRTAAKISPGIPRG